MYIWLHRAYAGVLNANVWLRQRAYLFMLSRRRHRLAHADLSYLNLQGIDLRGADLRHANLHHADLRHARLAGADLSGADLSLADMTEGQLDEVRSLAGATLPDGTIVGDDA